MLRVASSHLSSTLAWRPANTAGEVPGSDDDDTRDPEHAGEVRRKAALGGR